MSCRTREEVDATLQVAKLVPEELLGTVHCLRFSPSATSGEYSLLELDSALFEHVQCGKSLVIRGEKSEHAVLCSEDKTYDLKIADTSNLLIFIPGCQTADQLAADKETRNLIHTQISGFSNHYWELRRCRPKVKKLKKLLIDNPYEGPDAERKKDSTGTKYTTEDLLNQIQASEQELTDQLQTIHACKIEGCWRILEFDYEMRLLTHITQLVDSESWSFSKVPLNVCLRELQILEPQEMIEHCLMCYGKRFTDDANYLTKHLARKSSDMYVTYYGMQFAYNEPIPPHNPYPAIHRRQGEELELGLAYPTTKDTRLSIIANAVGVLVQYTSSGEVCFALDEDQICRATAQMLLQNAVKFNLSEFQEVWQQSVPEGMATRLDQLKGLALLDRSSRPETVCMLKTEDLPEDTQERFNHLFGLREKWTEADIAPYIKDLCGEKQTIGALLTKYARSSLQNSVKVYNSRRPLV